MDVEAGDGGKNGGSRHKHHGVYVDGWREGGGGGERVWVEMGEKKIRWKKVRVKNERRCGERSNDSFF